MNNADLRDWNETIEKARASKQDAMERAIRTRGVRRRMHLVFSKLFGRIEAMGSRWRNEQMNSDE